ncbi:metallophosphoesterase [Erwiniaceae bacterium BAC15a-03b]|uniref:Metallophosphoesterase n=1 Tax=Winslowiella arboricola TaxID=2978220 RepID=A0A9J6PQF8_9GAMM|nr:metallophosphoesterase [Winslowiella arboricola]MCU5775476.1 metallophosphoesterase [Winslowiella arboricola]MCU5779674.1 metallophosphoesterase [Winslowiella arboricola]
MLIAQLTDIHAAPDNDNMARLHQVINWLITVKPDLLVVTGDLTDNGWYEGYRAIETELQRVKCRYLVLPGNSDNKQMMRDCLQEAMHWRSDAALHFSEIVNGIPVIGIDTTIEGEARGDITRHLKWLATELDKSPQPALLFMHHPIFRCGIAPLDDFNCEGATALGQLIASSTPPLAICSGHVHRSMAAMIAGVPSYICGSVCPANPLILDNQRIPPVTDPAALMMHDLRRGYLASSHISV